MCKISKKFDCFNVFRGLAVIHMHKISNIYLRCMKSIKIFIEFSITIKSQFFEKKIQVSIDILICFYVEQYFIAHSNEFSSLKNSFSANA